MRCVISVWMTLLIITVLSACQSAPEALPTLAVVPSARTLEFWQSEGSTLRTPQSIDEWQFVGEAGDAVQIRAVETGEPVSLALFREEQPLAEGDSISLTLPDTGLYRVQVRLTGDTATDYDIGLSYTDQPRPGAATSPPQIVGVPTPTPAYSDLGAFQQRLGQPGEFGGRLSATAPQHVYTYEAEANTLLTLELDRISGTLDPFLTLYYPDGNPLAMDGDSAPSGNARLRNIYLNEAGLYSIQVNGAGLYGDYSLRIREGASDFDPDPLQLPTATPLSEYVTPTLAPAPADTRLSNHTPVIGNIGREGDFQRFTFRAEAGTVISLLVIPYQNSGLLPQLEVFDPLGAQIATVQSTASGGLDGVASATGVPLSESGAYTVILTGENGTTGAYVISYGRGMTAAESYRGELPTGDRATGSIDRPALRHTWQTTLRAGDVFNVAASPADSGFDPVLELVRTDGTLLYRDDNSGANGAALLQRAEIDETDVYLLRVYDATGRRTGRYTLLWRTVERAPTATPPPEAARLLTVNETLQPNTYQFYTFQGRAGQQVQIRVTANPEGALDPVAALLNPAGQVLAEADDTSGLNPVIMYTLPDDGSYSVRVNGYLSGGEFELTVSVLF